MMAKQYEVTGQVRLFNRLMEFMIRLGIAPKPMYVLTVKGRKSGKAYSTPVSLVEQDGKRWLVSPYGQVNWVKNARAAGEVQLLVGSGGTGWLNPVPGQKNTHSYTFTIQQAQTVRVGLAVRGRFALVNNGWFLDDWSLRRVGG